MNMKSVVLLVTVALIAGLLGCGASSVPAPSGSATRAPGAETKALQAPLTPVMVVDAKVEGAAQEAPPKSPGASAATASDQPAATNEERPEEQLPEVVAKVGDEVISGKELKRQTTFITRMRGKPDDSSLPLLHRRILDNLINERVLTILARNANVTVSDEEVKVEFEKSKSRMPSEEYFQQYLRDQDLTQDELMGLIRDSLIKRKYVEEKTKDLKPGDEEIAAQYEKLKTGGRMDRPQETSDVAHILVQVPQGADEAAWAKAKEKIDAARARIVAGDKFADVAKEVSDDPGSKDNGGAYPDTPKGKMVPEFEEKMGSTPVGDVSEPFRTKFGWHILTVTGKHAPGTRTLDEAKEDLGKSLARSKQMQAVKQMIDDARTSMKIEVLLPEPKLPAPTPGAPAPIPAAPPAASNPEAPAPSGATAGAETKEST